MQYCKRVLDALSLRFFITLWVVNVECASWGKELVDYGQMDNNILEQNPRHVL